MKAIFLIIGMLLVAAAPLRASAPADTALTFPLAADGTLPVWYVAGPFEQPTSGFGVPVDTDLIGESSIEPFAGKPEPSPLSASGTVQWQPQSIDDHGFLDLARSIGWTLPGTGPEKVWISKVGYAWTRILSAEDREMLLLLGSNASVKVLLNGSPVHVFAGSRGAVKDQDTIRVSLRRGANTLLLKVGNSHQNYALDFFGGTPWQWGAFARFVGRNGRPLERLTVSLDRPAPRPEMKIVSTFFFKNSSRGLLQRFDLSFISPWPAARKGTVTLRSTGASSKFDLSTVRYGANRFELFLPAARKDLPVQCTVATDAGTLTCTDTLHPEKHYELHLMLLTHTDIGYTHTQPVVKEMHLRTLDHVLALCRAWPDFRWTIETVWQLQEFERARPKAAFDELIGLIRSGRIGVSPVLTNPSTGWVSEEEMIRSFSAAGRYAADHGFTYTGAVYNDTPGLAWALPGLLKSAGVSLVACGLNEVYGGYALQQSLPKAFLWEGGDGARVVVYRSETYNEGAAYGLERGGLAVEQRMWERLRKLKSAGEDREMVLLTAAWMDNGDVATRQFEEARKWNETYAYPRFIPTTVARFAEGFSRRYRSSLRVLRGDWTSPWDIQFQGEPARTIRERWAQQQILTAERLDVLNSLKDPGQPPLGSLAGSVYESLLHFSGHGSGLEAGYGTRGDNQLTLDYREQYVRSALLGTEELLARARYRLIRPEEDFAGEGVMLCNPLSWKSDIPLDLELRDSSAAPLALTDMATGAAVPSFRDGYHLLFVAPAVPPLGFKKLALQPAQATTNGRSADLTVTPVSIANSCYRITFDSSSRTVVSVRDLTLGRELLPGAGLPFNEPLCRKGYAGGSWKPLPAASSTIVITDQRPARLVLSIFRPGQLFERTDYILWSGVKRIDIAHHVRLSRLESPSTAESYAVGFPFALRSPKVHMDVLGGWLTAPADRLPGALRDEYSIRRSVSLSDGTISIGLCAADSRVISWRSDTTNRHPALLATIVNNFPAGWNRNEENSGLWTFRFSISTTAGNFNPEAASRLGWEATTVFPAALTWLRPLPAETSFVTITGANILLGALKKADRGDGVIIRLVNVNPDSAATGTVRSSFFTPMRAFDADVFERKLAPVPLRNGTLEIRLRASETRTILLERSTD